MKRSKGVVYKRQQYILSRLKEKRTVRVEELARELQVSSVTIRRDLQEFEVQGLVSRFHGGASLRDGALKDDPSLVEEGTVLHLAEKSAIARHAASLVEEGDTIFMNSSSTCLMMLEYIKNKHVVVVTNNGKAVMVPRNPGVELILTGGEVYERKISMVGEVASKTLSRMTASKCFIGVGGISAQHGLTTSTLQETAINELMIKRCSGGCYVLADSSKLGRENNFFSAPIDWISALITDTAASPSEVEQIRKLDVDVILVSPL